MEKINHFIRKIPPLLWVVGIFLLLTAEATIVAEYQAKRFKATQTYALEYYDTTNALIYGGKFEMRWIRKTGDTSPYGSTGRTSGSKWFRMGPDTLVNLGSYDTTLTNPSVNKYGWKSDRTIGGEGITVAKTIDATTISRLVSVGISDSVTTSSTSITTISTIATTSNSSGSFWMTLTGELADGTNGTQTVKIVSYHNTAGTLTVDINTDLVTQHSGTGGSPAFSVAVSSANILVRITPGASASTTWKNSYFGFIKNSTP